MPNPNRQQSPASVTLESPGGFRVVIVDHGASIASIQVPARDGLTDVVLGYANAEEYRNDPYLLGATLGRYANRIQQGRLRLNGASYQLATDPADEGHCLHGGRGGFHNRTWALTPSSDGCRVHCRYVSGHGEQGFPGRLDVSVIYQLFGDSSLLIDYVASSDRLTVVNLANHAYFNLDGDASIEGHYLQLNANRYTLVDDALIPTGDIADARDTPFDFTEPVRLGERIANSGDRSALLPGYDTNFVLNPGDARLREAATLFSPKSGIQLKVLTTQPGLQLFTGDNLRAPFAPRAGVCLEAQNFPDAPNRPGFPGATLAAGETYRQQTVYEFGRV